MGEASTSEVDGAGEELGEDSAERGVSNEELMAVVFKRWTGVEV
jgi:hypothetical protein